MSTGAERTLNPAQLDQLSINTIRFLSVDAVQRANSDHPGLPLGAAPMAYVLWTRYSPAQSDQSPILQPRPRRPGRPGTGRCCYTACFSLWMHRYNGFALQATRVDRGRQPGRSTCQGLQFSYGVTPVRMPEYPHAWNDCARRWVQSAALAETLLVLTDGLSRNNPQRKPRMELIDLRRVGACIVAARDEQE